LDKSICRVIVFCQLQSNINTITSATQPYIDPFNQFIISRRKRLVASLSMWHLSFFFMFSKSVACLHGVLTVQT